MQRVYITLFISVIALSACSNVRQTLGLERKPPDEFRVVTRAPLTVPPDFTLHPPLTGKAASSLDTAPEMQAKQALFGTSAPEQPVIASTPTEAALLQQAGAGKTNPEIKAVIVKEYAQMTVANKTLLGDIITWKKNSSTVVVDPVKEEQRLEDNKAKGLPANTGTVPIIKPRKSSFF
jgi:hypothetical protein